MNEKVSFSKRVKKFFQGKKSVSNNIYNSAWVQDKNLNLSSDSALHQKLQLLSLHLEQTEYIGNIGTWEYCPRKKEFTLSKMSSNILEWKSEEHTSELQSRGHLVCRLLLEKKKKDNIH